MSKAQQFIQACNPNAPNLALAKQIANTMMGEDFRSVSTEAGSQMCALGYAAFHKNIDLLHIVMNSSHGFLNENGPDGFTGMDWCVFFLWPEGIDKLKAEGASLDTPNSQNGIPYLIQQVLRGNQPQQLDLLLTKNADVNVVTYISGTPMNAFSLACEQRKEGSALTVAKYMTQEFNAHTYLTTGRNAFSWAAQMSNPEIVKTISTQIGPDTLEQVDSITGHHPIFWSIFAGQEDTAKAMMELGANLNAQYKEGPLKGQTYKSLMVARGEAGEKSRIDLITKLGGKMPSELSQDELKVDDVEGAAAGVRIINKIDDFAVLCKSKGHFATAKKMAAEIDPYQTDKTGFTPSMWALELGDESAVAVMKILVKNNGGNLNASDINGMSLAHWAAAYGNTDVIKYLEPQNVSMSTMSGRACGINVKGTGYNIPEGFSPIHIAALVGAKSAVNALLKSGHGYDLTSEVGGIQRTAGELAKTPEIKNIIDVWNAAHPAEGVVAPVAAAGEDVAIDNSVNAKDASGQTLFSKACQSSDESNALSIASNERFNPEIKVQGRGPISEVTLSSIDRESKETLITTLHQSKADLNSQDLDGKTAPMLAIESGKVSLADYLIGLKADVSTQDFNGHNLAWYAAQDEDASDLVGLVASLSNMTPGS